MKKIFKRFFMLFCFVFIFCVFNVNVKAESAYKILKEDKNVSVTKNWDIMFNREISADLLKGDNIIVQDSKGNRIPVNLEMGKYKISIVVKAPKGGYKYNESYILKVSPNIKSKSGEKVNSGYVIKFTTASSNVVKPNPTNKKGVFVNFGPIEQGFQINKGIMYHNKKNEPVLYGGTIVMGGNQCEFFAFNTITKQFEKMISIPNCQGIVSMASDGDFVYFGTYNKAYLYRYNIKSEKLDKLSYIKNDKYIWDIKAYGSRIYLSTSPRNHVYKYYVKEKVLEDLGAFSNQEYAKSVEYYNGKVYAGVGPKAGLIEYDGKTKRNILPSKYTDQFVDYLKVEDSKLFIVLKPSFKVLSYDFNTKKFTERMNRISNSYYDYNPQFNDNFITFKGPDGYIFHYNKASDKLMCLQYNGGSVTCSGVVNNSYLASINQDGYYIENGLSGQNPKKIHLSSKGLKGGAAKPVYMYPYNDKIYFGGKMLSVYDVNSRKSIFKQAPGEVKSISILGNSLYTGNYANGEIWRYGQSAIDNPNSIDFTNESYFLKQIPKEHHQNRPSKMVANPKLGTVTVLSEPLPGYYGGTVTTYNKNNGKFYIRKDIVPKHYIYSMAYNTNKPSIGYLGSSSLYTYGSKPLNENAHLVKYDVITQTKLFDIIPEAGATRIASVAYSNNKVYCVTNKGTLIAIDGNNGRILKKVKNNWFIEVCASIDGNLYGITNRGFYRIDKNTLAVTCLKNNLTYPSRLNEDPITGKIYFYDNLNLWCYR